MKKIILIAFFSVILSSLSVAQGTVKGRILNASGDTLKGANISLKSDNLIGTMSNEKGYYILQIPDSSVQVLVISYVGYKTI